MKNEEINKYPVDPDALEYIREEWPVENSEQYYKIARAVVYQNGYALEYVNKDWAVKNPDKYYEIALLAVERDPRALVLVNKDWISDNSDKYKEVVRVAVNEEINKYPVDPDALEYICEEWPVENSEQYYKIALAVVYQNGYALEYVNKDWVVKNPDEYYAIALLAVETDPGALVLVNKDWISDNSDKYKEVARVAVKENEYALDCVNKDWAVENPKPYYEIALVAVKKDGYALEDVHEEWAVKNPDEYYEIVLAAVNRNVWAFRYASDVFRNNIKIIISLLINLDGKYSKTESVWYSEIDKMLGSSCAPSEDILLYLYIFSNKNVSNNFKNALFEFFIKKFENSDNFTLYKNILEFYLTSSDNYNKDFPKHELLKDLSEDHSKQLHMFLSLAEHSLMENSELAKLLKNDPNNTIKNYLIQKDTHHLKSIKDFNIYSFLLPKNLFVINYDKIIKKMKNTPLNYNLIKLILCYSKIEGLLKLSKAVNLGDKLEVKYLDIDPEFERGDGDITIGIEAWVNAIKNDGFLRNTGKYKYDSLSPIYNIDIDLNQQSKLIELIK